MNKKRGEDIPCQFISKHSHKYILRKTLVNTKFQWLMKYINQNDANYYQENTLSKAIKIQPKLTTVYTNRKNINERRALMSRINYNQSKQEKVTKTSLSVNINQKSFKLLNQQKSRVQSQSQQNIFIQKRTLRNKSLLLHNFNHRKTPVFFQKQNRRITTAKMKTQPSFEKTNRTLVRERYDNQPFILSPWGLHQDQNQNHQNVFN